jgi:D-3-phosphoglycerate dehydrogenase / 2-oxoglutarate reductase
MNGVVLVTDHPFDRGLDPERAALAPLGVEVLVADSDDPARLAELASRGVDGILVCYAQVPEPLIRIAAAGGCRIVSRYGIGYDNVDVAAATRAGVVVTTVPDYCLDEVSDHTLALLLSAARAVDETSAGVRVGLWPVPRRRVHRLAGRTLALIGLGGIGSRVVARAGAFGLEVVAYDPFADPSKSPNIRWVGSIEEAFAAADFISLHAPLTDATRHIVNGGSLAHARRAPILINTARGGLVDLDAVRDALDEGRLTAAALDVTEPEPLPADHPFRRDPRVLITAHTAFRSEESQDELQRRAAEEIARMLRGQSPRNARNPEVLGSTTSLMHRGTESERARQEHR